MERRFLRTNHFLCISIRIHLINTIQENIKTIRKLIKKHLYQIRSLILLKLIEVFFIKKKRMISIIITRFFLYVYYYNIKFDFRYSTSSLLFFVLVFSIRRFLYVSTVLTLKNNFSPISVNV